MTAWKTLFKRWLNLWHIWRYERWKARIERHLEKRKEELPLYFALDATLRQMQKLRAPEYDYRVGGRITEELYFDTWDELRWVISEFCMAAEKETTVAVRKLEVGSSTSLISFDEFLGDETRFVSQGEVATLGPFFDDFCQKGLAAIEALRIAKSKNEPSRFHYYQTRCGIMLHDLEALAPRLQALAMDSYYER